MKACDDCRDESGKPHHPSSAGCNWLDDQTTCPHCGGPLHWFRGTALGDVMDAMAMDATVADTIGP